MAEARDLALSNMEAAKEQAIAMKQQALSMLETADTMLENINEAIAAMRVKADPPDTPPAKPAKKC